MRCPTMGGQWCAYWFGERCRIDDFYIEKTGCIGSALLTPFFQDTQDLLEVIDGKELNAQIDVCGMVIRGAEPLDHRNPIQVCEVYEVKDACRTFLKAVEVYRRRGNEVKIDY